MPTMPLPAALLDAWRSRKLVGQNTHSCIVRVRKGHMEHGYLDERMLHTEWGSNAPIFPPLIWQGQNHSCWKGTWIVDGDWITLPNIESVNWTKDFSSKGGATATIVMDNVAFTDTEGVAGLYHEINRGYFSPTKGVQVLSRPKLWGSQPPTWNNVLNGGYQIEVWEGYGSGEDVQPGGSQAVRTFVGLIDDCELESHPDKITITTRDYNVLLTDQRIMGWNIAREIKTPLTFADRRWVMGETKEFGRPGVSSGRVKVSGQQGISWVSAPQADKQSVQWIEVHLPAGHYEDVFLAPEFAGLEVWFALYVNTPASYNDSVTLPEGWVDYGYGNVPGTDIPFIRHMGSIPQYARRWQLGTKSGEEGSPSGFDFANGTVLRVYFRNLHRIPGFPRDRPYGVQLNAFYTFKFGKNPLKPPGAQVNAKHWILVNDAADVIRMLLIWAGFPEWHVEDFGWSLAHPMQFSEDKFFMDVVDDILKQGNFVYYMAAPTNNDMSIGVPHFEQQRATSRPAPSMIEVKDTDMLEAATVKWDLSNLPYVIRYRGEVSDQGATLFMDLVKRWMGTYFPPWSGEHYFKLGDVYTGTAFGFHTPLDRVAGVRRHFTQTLGQGTTVGLQSNEECLFACVLAAVQYCLQMVTGEIQIPGLPGFELNEQVSVIEGADGVNSRMWIAAIESDHTLGPQGKWTMKLSGSYIDVQDMYMIASDYLVAYKKLIENRPPTSEYSPAPIPDPGVIDIANLGAGAV
jgi:hypothetical protein